MPAPPCGSSHDLCLSSEVSQGEEGVQGAAGSGGSPLQSARLSEGPRLASALTRVTPKTEISLPVSLFLISLGYFVFWHKERAFVLFHVWFVNHILSQCTSSR